MNRVTVPFRRRMEVFSQFPHSLFNRAFHCFLLNVKFDLYFLVREPSSHKQQAFRLNEREQSDVIFHITPASPELLLSAWSHRTRVALVRGLIRNEIAGVFLFCVFFPLLILECVDANAAEPRKEFPCRRFSLLQLQESSRHSF
jgi:hypothetical protein